MSRLHRFLICAMSLLSIGLMSGCIDSREEIWINPNGSGRAEISFSLPAAAAKLQGGEVGIRALIKKFIAASPTLKSPTYEVLTVGDRLNIRFAASFDSALDLKKLSSGDSLKKMPTAASGLAGKVRTKWSGRTLDFSREISAGTALPGSMFMPKSQFEGHRLTHIIHLPNAAKASNASRIEDAGRTLIWDFPLSEAIKAPVTTHFITDIPIPWWLIVASGLFTLLLIGGAYLWIVKRRKKRPIPR